MSSDEDKFYKDLPYDYREELDEIEHLHDGTTDDFIGMIKAFKLGMKYQLQKEKAP